MSKWFKKYYRNPRTRNEERHNQDEYEGSSKQQVWCRAKRRPCHLADSWWDRHSCVQRTWKEHRKTKYRPGKRGKKHTIFCEGYLKAWDLKEYCEEHDIPCNMEKVTEPYSYWKNVYEKVEIGQKPYYISRWYYRPDETGKMVRTEQKVLWFYSTEYKEVYIGQEEVHTHRLLGYNFTWWSNKDIGIEYILNREHRY